jgi:hypothetical protein
MSRFTSLIQIINSLSKSERKKISSVMDTKNNNSDYSLLYKLIENRQIVNHDIIKREFQTKRPGAAFNTAVNYLFEMILGNLSELRADQDSFFNLSNRLMHVKILFEKSIYDECFLSLEKIQHDALKFENYNMLLIAQKTELDYLLCLNFPEMTEQELLSKQMKLNDTIKKLRKVNEHASLYELLKYRILNRGSARSKKHIQELNDLIVSEMSIVSGTSFDNFEIKKNHKLFQSNYLIFVGDYNTALHSFYELHSIFEQNKHLLSNPPIYYLMTIEGVLESLRNIRNYDGMQYFIEQLQQIESSSLHFKLQVKCVIFLYSIFPLIDTGRFSDALVLIDAHHDEIYSKISMLILERQIQLSLYTAIILYGCKDFIKAKKSITKIISGEKRIFSAPLLRTTRLVNLMILNELNEFDYIDMEVRSIKREIQNKENTFQIEQLMLKVIGKSLIELKNKDRELLWEKTQIKIIELKKSKFELQLLHIFDFTAWIESKIRNIPLENILLKKNEVNA